MVVAKENDVEAFYRFSYLPGNVFVVVGGRYATFPSAMEESYNDVGLFSLLEYLYPVACALNHLLEAQPRPKTLMQPVGNGGCQHT